MKLVFNLLGLFLLLVAVSCSENERKVFTEADIAIIPEPLEMQLGEGAFQFDANTVFAIADETQKPLMSAWVQKFKILSDWDLQISEEVPKDNYIQLIWDETLPQEHYELEVSESAIKVSAGDMNGFIYALESIRQLLPIPFEKDQKVSNVDWLVPAVKIKDGPQFQWRGLMLDVSRHFFEKEYILKTIDRLAFLKMNTLHLHLVDDQGWRIEIKKYPKLTEIGAFRVDQKDEHWNNRGMPSMDEKATYGGFYTQEDIQEIVSYATAKGITVVPEIEMPAHVMSAIAAYPELACYPEPMPVPTGGVWPLNKIYCVGKESTFEFLENVLTEVMELFPSKYIHIGGDEANKTSWETCPLSQKRMREENLNSVEELQSYFIKRIERFLNANGRILIGWDEILEGGLAPQATVMSWRGIKGGWEASKEGHDVVMSPGTHCYFDHYQGPQENEPVAIGGYTPLSKVYQFNPIVDSMSQKQRKHVLGGQANLWSEYVTTTEHSEYMLFPRLTALSEALWTSTEQKNWTTFSRKVQNIFSRFDEMGINYAISAYNISANSEKNEETGTIELALMSEFPEVEVKYVTDVGVLEKDGIAYENPITINQTKTIKAQSFQSGVPLGKPFEKTFVYHQAVGKPVDYSVPCSEVYQGTGGMNLVNVLRGTTNFRDGQWQAWLDTDMEVIIDLGEPLETEKVIVGTMENQGPDIYFPTKIEVMISLDGVDFKTAGIVERPYLPSGQVRLKDFEITFDSHLVRYVKVMATCLKENARKRGSWLFVDEILVQ
ncbi:MAG: family 20 glycosylhydrolase [Bacteroidota bacterium]